MTKNRQIFVFTLAVFLPLAPSARAQVSTNGPRSEVVDATEVVRAHANGFRDLLDRYPRDRETFERCFPSRIEPERITRLEKFYADWQQTLKNMDFDKMDRSGKVDYLLFRRRLDRDQANFAQEADRLRRAWKLVPFAREVIALEYRKRALESYDIQKLAPELEALSRRIVEERGKVLSVVEASLAGSGEERGERIPEDVLKTAEDASRELQKLVEEWFNFYRGYEPVFTWWMAAPSKRLAASIGFYADAFSRDPYVRTGRPRPESKEQLKPSPGNRGSGGEQAHREQPEAVGFSAEHHGSPVGAKRLAELLHEEMIPYSAAELVDLGKRELEWCRQEQRKVAKELGFDDPAKALEHVKTLHVPPGQQPAVIRRLALEAIAYLEKHDLVTIPQLAKDSWRVGMMSAGRQRHNPFFTGGSTISVSYPNDEMDHSDKLMSMRGNNPHFSAATVHHELIPGHHLQDFMTTRYNTHRAPYATVFWGEGWALYWELLLWDHGFAKSPEDKMGFLFWRMHRCARIIFSLGYHLGEMTPQACVDMLVDVVGHERTHAEGEVRRSLSPGTPTLYQSAYMLGAMQFYVLHRELVKSGKMTTRDFHDRILRGHRIPVEMVRIEISDVPVTRDYKTNWRFAEEFRHP